jgi:hypothetical protein
VVYLYSNSSSIDNVDPSAAVSDITKLIPSTNQTMPSTGITVITAPVEHSLFLLRVLKFHTRVYCMIEGILVYKTLRKLCRDFHHLLINRSRSLSLLLEGVVLSKRFSKLKMIMLLPQLYISVAVLIVKRTFSW